MLQVPIIPKVDRSGSVVPASVPLTTHAPTSSAPPPTTGTLLKLNVTAPATATGPAPKVEEPTLTQYSDKSIVLRGEAFTRTYSKNLATLGGLFNNRLKDGGGPGWIFSLKKQDQVEAFVREAMEGKVTPMEKSERKDYVAPTTSVKSTAPRLTPSHTSVQSSPPPAPVMQTVTYMVPLPTVGQEIMVVTHGGSGSYRVTEVENHGGIVDVARIVPKGGDHVSTMMITNGRWQVYGMLIPHDINLN